MTRKLSDNLASLVKQLDKKVAAHKRQKLALVIILLTDEQGACEKLLAAFEKKNVLRSTVLAVFPKKEGPKNYKIAANAETTVMMWVGETVKVNYVFATSTALSSKAAAAVVESTSLILK